MKVVKHFYRVILGFVISFTCKHGESHEGSCPFTGYTYTTCSNCLRRLKVVKTI